MGCGVSHEHVGVADITPGLPSMAVRRTTTLSIRPTLRAPILQDNASSRCSSSNGTPVPQAPQVDAPSQPLTLPLVDCHLPSHFVSCPQSPTASVGNAQGSLPLCPMQCRNPLMVDDGIQCETPFGSIASVMPRLDSGRDSSVASAASGGLLQLIEAVPIMCPTVPYPAKLRHVDSYTMCDSVASQSSLFTGTDTSPRDPPLWYHQTHQGNQPHMSASTLIDSFSQRRHSVTFSTPSSASVSSLSCSAARRNETLPRRYRGPTFCSEDACALTMMYVRGEIPCGAVTVY